MYFSTRIIAGVLLVFSLLVSACNIVDSSAETADVEAQLNTPFTLSEGERAFFENENLVLTFLDVREDSRCPLEVECIWEGQLSVEMQLRIDDQQNESLLLEGFIGADEGESVSGNFSSYTLALDRLSPYPESETPIAGAKTGRFTLSRTIR